MEMLERQASCSLSINQEARLLLEMTRSARLVPFHLFRCFVLNGPVDKDLLECALNHVIRRHHGLRTGFAPVGPAAGGTDVRSSDKANFSKMGVPPRCRPFWADVKVPLAMKSVDAGDEEQSESVALALLREEASRAFDLGQPPLVRAVLVRVDQHRHYLLAVVHHLLADEWSMQIFERELRAIYDALLTKSPVVLAAPAVPYHEFAAWQRRRLASGQLDSSLSYWKQRWQQYGNAQLRVKDFPFARDTPKATLAVERERLSLVPSLCSLIPAVLARRRVTLYMLLLTAFVRSLHLATGKTKLAIWGQFANRTRADAESLIGWCANAQLLGMTCERGTSLDALLDQARDVAVNALRHQEIPPALLWDVLEKSGDLHPIRLLSDAWVSFDLRVRSDADADPSPRMERIDLSLATTGVRGIQMIVLKKETGVSLVAVYSRDTFHRDAIRALLVAMNDALVAILCPARVASRCIHVS